MLPPDYTIYDGKDFEKNGSKAVDLWRVISRDVLILHLLCVMQQQQSAREKYSIAELKENECLTILITVKNKFKVY